MNGESNGSLRPGLTLAAILLVAAAVSLLVVRAGEPPAPLAAGAPAGEFSAGRAREVLRDLTGDAVPHPVGSDANAAVRARILARLVRLGYEPQVQDEWACSAYGTCASVQNVVTRLDGREPGVAVLVAAHYDSVAAGPGASDDGAGAAAVLEIARALKSLPPPRHSVVLLLTDGEEGGLLGAEAFVAGHPWAKEIRAAVNMDNRGTTGPALMFETSAENAWLVDLFARAVRRPATNSILYFIYKLLPNDTDFSVFKRAGMVGFNFGFIGNVPCYHTTCDSFASSDPRSLQQEGEDGFASLRALAEADLDNPPAGDAVFFDLLGRWTIWWPAWMTLRMALAALVLLAIALIRLWRRGMISIGACVAGFFAWLAALVAAPAVGYALQKLLAHVHAFPQPWVAHAWAGQLAFWTLGIAAVAVFAVLLARRGGFWGAWAGMWIGWTLAAVAFAWLYPELCFPVLVPSAAGAVAGLAGAIFGDRAWTRITAVALPLIVVIAVDLPLAASLYAGLGAAIFFVLAGMVALVASPLAPLFASLEKQRWMFAAAPLALAFAAAVAAALLPHFTTQVPERLNLAYSIDLTEGGSSARWFVYSGSGRLPAALRSLASFAPKRTRAFPWNNTQVFAAAAEPLPLAVPVADHGSMDRGGTHVDAFFVKSLRGAPITLIALPPAVKIAAATLNDRTLPPLSERALKAHNGWQVYTCLTTPPEGIVWGYLFAEGTGEAVSFDVADLSFDLPPLGAALARARPVNAVPSQDGDVTVIVRHVK